MSKQKLFNGKPMSHWQKMADDLVMRCLVEAIGSFESSLASLPQKIARKRLIVMAERENPYLYKELVDERNRCRKNLQTITAFIIKGTRRTPKKLNKERESSV